MIAFDNLNAIGPVRQQVRVGKPATALAIRTLALVGGKRAAPEKIRTQRHGYSHSFDKMPLQYVAHTV